MTRLLHLLVVAVLSLAAHDVIAGAIFATQVPDSRLTVPTGRICVLCDFGATPADPSLYSTHGVMGNGQLAEGPEGDVYGTSLTGGSGAAGTVFKVTRTGQLSVLHNFDKVKAAQPEGGLVAEQDAGGKPTGTFFGTTVIGGIVETKPRASGTIFSVRAGAGTAPASVSVIYDFRNGTTEGMEWRVPCPPPSTKTCGPDAQAVLDASAAYPNSAPVIGSDGALYGIASVGNTGFGVLYRIPKRGGDRAFKALCAGGPLALGTTMTFADLAAKCMLSGVSKNYPMSLAAGYDGKLYGTLVGGTTANLYGAVFQATITGSVSLIYKFKNTDGAAPFSVIQGTESALYGTTFRGGPANLGVVFKLSQANGQWSYRSLVEFSPSGPLGGNPFSGVVDGKQLVAGAGLVPDGYLYGTTKSGGLGGSGTIFRVRRDGTDYKPLYIFPNDPRAGMTTFPAGRLPSAPLLIHSDGHLYGTTPQGGLKNSGVLFRLSGVTQQMTNALGPIYTIVKGTPVSEPDPFVEVRVDEATGQINPKCDPKNVTGPRGVCVLPGVSDYQLRIDVKNCRNPHIVQFIRRREVWLDPAKPAIANPAGSTGKCLMGSNTHVPYALGAWHTDADCGKPNPYIDQNPASARVYAPYQNPDSAQVGGIFAMTVWDQPGLSDTAGLRSRADFKDFVICNCAVVRQVNWSRLQIGKDPAKYVDVSITTPDQSELDAMNSQLILDGFEPVLSRSLAAPALPGEPSPLVKAIAHVLGLQRASRK